MKFVLAKKTSGWQKLLCVFGMILVGLGNACVLSAEEPMFRIGVVADFSRGTMRLIRVNANGPSSRVRGANGFASLEAEDVIVRIDGRPIQSHGDFIQSVNNSLDGILHCDVRDKNTGRVLSWTIAALPMANDAYEMSRDTFNRAIRTDSIPHNTFRLRDRGETLSHNLSSVIHPFFFGEQEQKSATDSLEATMIGIESVKIWQYQNPNNPVFRAGDFASVDQTVRNAFFRLKQETNEQTRERIVESCRQTVKSALQDAVVRRAQQLGKRITEEATLPGVIEFQIRTTVPMATVQLLSVADKVNILFTRKFEYADPLPIAAVAELDKSNQWETLPQGQAGAYGRYHYRLIDQFGNVVKKPNYSSRGILNIVQQPQGGVITF